LENHLKKQLFLPEVSKQVLTRLKLLTKSPQKLSNKHMKLYLKVSVEY